MHVTLVKPPTCTSSCPSGDMPVPICARVQKVLQRSACVCHDGAAIRADAARAAPEVSCVWAASTWRTAGPGGGTSGTCSMRHGQARKWVQACCWRARACADHCSARHPPVIQAGLPDVALVPACAAVRAFAVAGGRASACAVHVRRSMGLLCVHWLHAPSPFWHSCTPLLTSNSIRGSGACRCPTRAAEGPQAMGPVRLRAASAVVGALVLVLGLWVEFHDTQVHARRTDRCAFPHTPAPARPMNGRLGVVTGFVAGVGVGGAGAYLLYRASGPPISQSPATSECLTTPVHVQHTQQAAAARQAHGRGACAHAARTHARTRTLYLHNNARTRSPAP